MNQHDSGILFVVGLGPGAPGLLTPDAARAIERADAVVGYRGYLDRIAGLLDGKQVIGRALGQEAERARIAEKKHEVAQIEEQERRVAQLKKNR